MSTPHNGTPTSIEAAESMKPHAPNLEALTLAIVRAAGDVGVTDDEIDTIARNAGVETRTLRPRRVSLVSKGAVRDSNETRKTSSGRNAVVWKVAKKEGEQ